ncbi:hypothetical protein EDF46_0438 [Frondihabitans sp. PhB188]|uniref:hypothetical protein n=1 Tax=Frondihabitans sp. PhB188 TaxID=2485200 RepID=UPI000F49FADC|nr:hypothetical protein [Frondihabitans sp. PhB188]ROQ41071.1 hypothetical protein EDF46_0438 [Frondihabitans sp. PhB188]
MNTEPPTGDDLNRMLVSMKQNVLEGAVAHPVKRRRRNWGIALGVIAFLGLGAASGGVALGLVPSPFTASAPVAPVTSAPPAPSPTATTAPPPQPSKTATPVAGPRSTVPITCSALGEAGDLQRLAPALAWIAPTSASPVTATIKSEGVLTCSYSDDASGMGTSLQISAFADAAEGRKQIAGWIAGGSETAANVGSVSAQYCGGPYEDCSVNFVAGDFWVVASYTAADHPTVVPAALTSVIRDMASALAPLTAVEPWTPPTSIWTDVTTCDAMATATPIDEILGTASVTEPFATGTDGGDVISNSHVSLLCSWQASTPGVDENESMNADLSVGGASQLEGLARKGDAGTPITVEGADSAFSTCDTSPAEGCLIDVETDGSWLRVGQGAGVGSDRLGVLVRVAASLIAGQKGR